MRATAFVAIAVWATIQLFQVTTRDAREPLLMLLLTAASTGGAVGALLGKAGPGMFIGACLLVMLSILVPSVIFVVGLFLSLLGGALI